MKKIYLALALVFAGCAVSLSAQTTTTNEIAVFLTDKYCTTTTTTA